MLKLTAHTVERTRQYGLALSWIEATVAAPDWTVPDPRERGVTRSFKAIPERGGRVMRVAHRPDGDDVLVLSAFFRQGSEAMKPKASYDPEADAIGISFKPDGVEYAESEEVAPGLVLDYGADGRVIGAEILGVRRFLAEGVPSLLTGHRPR